MISLFRVTDLTNREHFVNPALIRSVSKNEGAGTGSIITFANGDTMSVQEEVTAVLAGTRGASLST